MIGSTCRMLQLVRRRTEAERLQRPGWILVAICHHRMPVWYKDAIWMKAEAPGRLYTYFVTRDKDYDTAQPFYRVSRKFKDMMIEGRQDKGLTFEIIRPDLLRPARKRA